MATGALALVLCGLSLAQAAVYLNKYPTCKRDFKKIGCFYEDPKAVQLINDRDPKSPLHQNITIDWRCYDKYLHGLACRCNAKAKAAGYDHFSIRYYGLCYGMKNPAKAQRLPPKGCAAKHKGKIRDCTLEITAECAGRYVGDYIYQIGRDGGFGPWGEFGNCSTTCGVGKQFQRRYCNNPTPLGNGKKCSGESERSKVCNITNCIPKVDGGWGPYSNWSTCKALPSVDPSSCNPCPPGITERRRLCNNPAPAHGGKNCSGSFIEAKPCNVDCSIDGRFSNWTEYTVCSKRCGGGVQYRSRECNNPPPFGPLGKKCVGNTVESRICNPQVCPAPVDGGFGEWSTFSVCSKTCGAGVQIRSRKCDKPAPAGLGKDCNGRRHESRACVIKPCPVVNGGFGEWSAFSTCTKTCGGGFQVRTRKCDKPAPTKGGRPCVGPLRESKTCNTNACPGAVDGGFGEWSTFSTCTKTCGGGFQVRTRKCDKPAPAKGGKECVGPLRETKGCKNDLCPGVLGCTKAQDVVEDFLRIYHKTRYAGKPLSGKFYKTVFDIQKAAADECVSLNITLKEVLEKRLLTLEIMIKVAIGGGSINFARETFGRLLFVFIKIKILAGLPIDEIEKLAVGYLDKLKITIGVDFFNTLTSSHGDATLMFAIDTTGSMAADILAAKAIAKTIINQTRHFQVDYILSPFNDPTTGPVTHKTEKEREGFVSAIDALKANGGGDCPELSITGMISALQAGPRFGSPMFVFTDASAKDDTPDKLAALKALATEDSATINFFVNGKGCPGKGTKTYEDIASYTSGQLFPLKSQSELVKFTSFVAKSLSTDTIIASGGTRVGFTTRPAAAIVSHAFFIDDGIADFAVSVSVTVQNTASQVTLTSPTGVKVAATATVALVAIFEVRNARPGKWALNFPGAVGGYEFNVLGVSKKPIDFSYYFLYKDSATSPSVSLEQPVAGAPNTMVIRLGGVINVKSSSLAVDLVDDRNNVIVGNLKLSKMGVPDFRKVAITSPSGRFKVRLTGRTKTGYYFQRQSRGLSNPTKALTHTSNVGKDFTVPLGAKNVQVQIQVVNLGAEGEASFSAHATYGQVTPASQKVVLKRGQSIQLTYNAPSDPANKGKTERITVVGSFTARAEFGSFTTTVDLLLI